MCIRTYTCTKRQVKISLSEHKKGGQVSELFFEPKSPIHVIDSLATVRLK